MALTGRQEVFCRKVALENMTQRAAYSCAYEAGTKTEAAIDKLASSVASHPEVIARIEVLRQGATAAAIKTAGYSLAQAITEAEEARQDAKGNGQSSAAVAAVTLKAKLSGLLVEKKEVTTRGPLDDQDVAGLVAIRDEVNAKLQRAREALEMSGDQVAPPVPARRVIG